METLAKTYLENWAKESYCSEGGNDLKALEKNGIAMQTTSTKLSFYEFEDGSLIYVYINRDNKTAYQHYDSEEDLIESHL